MSPLANPRSSGARRRAPDAGSRWILGNLFDRRTSIVMAVLVGAMTTVSGLLLLLNPAPLAPADGLALAALPAQPDDHRDLFHTDAPLDTARWQAIVIHHSGQPAGNADSIHRLHDMLDYGGLGYHFVIGNGDGAGDGRLQIGFRWTGQTPGVHAAGPHADWYNAHAIAICLVGNGDRNPLTEPQMRQLVELVTALQLKLQIPRDRVVLHSNIAPTTSPGRLFDSAGFREQLVDLRAAPVSATTAMDDTRR